ncbi:MAG: ABC transporter permease [Lachnospiraceae bacterium]
MFKGNRVTVVLIISLIVLSIVSIFVGVIDLNIVDVLNGDFEQIEIVLISRLPRLMAILCTGIGMGVAGLIMQQLCMNKFVSPSTGATVASSQFGILVAMIFFPSSTLIQKTIFAFIAAIVGTWIFVFFVQKIKFKDIIMVPLVGIMFGNIIGGITDYLSYKYELVQALSSWLVGDFSLILRGRYEIVFLVVPLVILAFIFANHFNIVGMGEDFSKNLGVNYNIVLFAGLSIAALITASVVVTVGTVPYLGLIIPNVVSMFKGDKIRGSLLDTALFGAVFVLSCDIIGRVINFPYEIPINLTVGVIGSIIFIGLLFRRLNPGKKKTRLHPAGNGCSTPPVLANSEGGAIND